MNMTNDKQSVKTLNVSPMKHNLQRDQELHNPCLEEHNLSLKCLSDNNYIHGACRTYFQSYRDCQLFWKRVVADRAKKNIIPHLPFPQDRTKIKQEYLKFPIVK